MSPDSTRHPEDKASARRWFLSLFPRGLGVVIGPVATNRGLVPTRTCPLRAASPQDRSGANRRAVEMCHRVADAHRARDPAVAKLRAAMNPALVRLKAGLAQIVFYRGIRLVMLWPDALQILTPCEVSCRNGRFLAEVLSQAHGFRVGTRQTQRTKLGVVLGFDVNDHPTERRAQVPDLAPQVVSICPPPLSQLKPTATEQTNPDILCN